MNSGFEAESGPFGLPHDYSDQPYSFEEVRSLRVDTGETVFVFPYITLRKIEYKDLNRKKEEGCIEIHFDRGIVQITGLKVLHLLTALQREVLFSIRTGIASNPAHPQIKSVSVKEEESR